MKNKIKQIVLEEFSSLINNIENDFKNNYIRKNHNFLLNQLDEEMTAHMVFVSSFESKSGNAIEKCAKRIAILRYGKENVPTIVNPHNLKHSLEESSINGQIIVTDIDIENGDLQGRIAGFRQNRVAIGKGKNRKESRVTQDTIKQLLDNDFINQYKDGMIHYKPVDLAYFDSDKEEWNIMELKAGGDLDSSNVPSNINKLLTEFVAMNSNNCNAYFATLYHKDGEGNTWTGAVKKHLNYPLMFLIGSDFWNKILPEGIKYEEFTKIYKEALEEIDLNARIRSMIKNCIS